MFDWLVNGVKGLGDGLAGMFTGGPVISAENLGSAVAGGSVVPVEGAAKNVFDITTQDGSVNRYFGDTYGNMYQTADAANTANKVSGMFDFNTYAKPWQASTPGLAASTVQPNFLKDTAVPAMGIYGAYKSGKAAEKAADREENEYNRKLANIGTNTQVASKVWGGSNNGVLV